MGSPAMVNNASFAMTAIVAAAKTLNPTVIPTSNEKRFFAPTPNAAASEDSLEPSALLAILSAAGSKKDSTLPELNQTLLEPDPSDPEATSLELDELWSFVLKRANKRWIWIALCRHTRQVVAYVIGDRSQSSCKKLWERIPSAYRRGHCYSDFWEAYQLVIPAQQHTAAGKETGLTAHVERWNLTLRQRLGRFVRKSLSFSKSDTMHEVCLRLFLYDYNHSVALSSG